jgi:conjugative transposon TraN protein
MKSIINISMWLCLLILAMPIYVRCQNVYVNNLELTENKTTSIVFPYAIESVDLGSQAILAQKVSGSNNVLQVKADTTAFNETNLTVITEGGSLHQFNVRYCSNPASCYFIVSKIGILESVQSVIFSETNPVTLFEKVYRSIASSDGKIKRAKNGKVKLLLRGIYVKGSNVFVSVSIQNDSHLSFDVEALSFTVKERKQAKRTAIQENPISPVHASKDLSKVDAQSSANVIYAFEKFTIPNSKELIIDLVEKTGGRNISMKVKSKDINNSQPVNFK